MYLFGVKEADCFGALRLSDGRALLFVPRLPQEYASWMGPIKSLEWFKTAYAVDDVYYVDELAKHLREDLKASSLLTIRGTNLDSGLAFGEVKFEGMESFTMDDDLSKKFSVELTESRVVKSPQEIALLQFVNDVSSAAHVEVMKTQKVNVREFLSEATFRYQSFLRGCSGTGYNCICPAGERNAILHYGHSGEPNPELVLPGTMKLHDMGAEYHGYSADVTVSFPAEGLFTREQRTVYEAVWQATLAVERAVCPGISYTAMHRLSQRTMLAEMTKAGLFHGDVEEMMAVDLCGHFMPHGLGHNLGLDVHDVGGYKPGETRRDNPDMKQNLRCGRELQEGQVLTVEPGFYFTDFLIQTALSDPAKARFINNKRLQELRPVGGVRIEDDIVITARGCRVLTKVPRTVREICAVMSGAEWSVGAAAVREYVAPDWREHAGIVADYKVTVRGQTLPPFHAKAMVEEQLKWPNAK